MRNHARIRRFGGDTRTLRDRGWSLFTIPGLDGIGGDTRTLRDRGWSLLAIRGLDGMVGLPTMTRRTLQGESLRGSAASAETHARFE
ncbi:MAG: hypothetical protein QGH76_02425, partial [Phycisphaerales bacterium]|nr:hypothetical protein [Phycisphaerales bacterium]